MTYRIDCACGTSWQGPELDVVSWAARQHQRTCRDVLTFTSWLTPSPVMDGWTGQPTGEVFDPYIRLVDSDYVLPEAEDRRRMIEVARMCDPAALAREFR